MHGQLKQTLKMQMNGWLVPGSVRLGIVFPVIFNATESLPKF